MCTKEKQSAGSACDAPESRPEEDICISEKPLLERHDDKLAAFEPIGGEGIKIMFGNGESKQHIDGPVLEQQPKILGVLQIERSVNL